MTKRRSGSIVFSVQVAIEQDLLVRSLRQGQYNSCTAARKRNHLRLRYSYNFKSNESYYKQRLFQECFFRYLLYLGKLDCRTTVQNPPILITKRNMQHSTETEDISFLGNDPGAVRHGNFINYYTFHPPEQRIENFSPIMFPKKSSGPIVALDVGCNSGELTKQFHLYLKTLYPNEDCHILGLDIDPVLIKRAQAYSCDQITFLSGDIMKSNTQDYIKRFLENHGKKKFDIVFCFSVTMWIHLNRGDDGLTCFLENMKRISRTIVMELQPWHCYRNAQRRLKKKGDDFPLYHKLNIRSDVTLFIENKISSSGFKMFYESPESKWHRKIQSFVESDG